MSLIKLQNVSKTYYLGGEVPVRALHDISLEIEVGEFVSIMGPSGSGKSTLLAVLGLLDRADSGKFFLLGKDISDLVDSDYALLRNKFFGFIFQMFNLLPKLNVVENTMLPFIYSGEDNGAKRQGVLRTLKNIGLGDRLSHRPNQLSGGQQQRVAIARALANDPLIILADEPTGNLDSRSSREIMRLLKELNDQGKTIIMVTHEPDIAAWSSRILTLHDGEIIKDERRGQSVEKGGWEKAVEFPRRQHRAWGLAGLKNYCYEACLAIAGNKLRSFLSILGVMIGVAAVIAMLALGEGARRSMEESLSSLGTNILMVRAPRATRGVSFGAQGETRFNFADLDALRKIEGVKYAVPYVTGRAQVVYQSKNWNTSVVGTSGDYFHLRNLAPVGGEFFSAAEGNSRNKEVLLGQTVVRELFGEEDPVGRSIRINRVSFLVKGVLPAQGAMGWQNLDDQVVVPVRTAMYRLLGRDYISYFEVQGETEEKLPVIKEEITAELTRLHRLSGVPEEMIEITDMSEIQKAAGAVTATLAYLLGSIAAVSLLVGGIGIMNIMLVMVMERTHEIGLRKALGAQRSDILVQFLIEAVLICLFGGVVGILFGAGISWALSALANWNTIISFGSIALAFLFSVLVGIVFGLWPAWRAAKLLPVEALRYE